jgi:hypothetical protein
MMIRHSRILMQGLAGLIVVLASGCSHWIELTDQAAQSPPSQTTIARDVRVPLLLEAVRISQNGAPVATPPAVERQVLGALEATQLFSQYFQSGYEQPAPHEPRVTIRLRMDNHVDPHPGETAWSGFVIGASMFLLSPVIWFDYDYGTHMSLEVERWDGQMKQYAASSSGSAHYYLFGASPHVIEELKGQVTDNCLASLLDQLVRDHTFYLAESSPQSETTIRTVSVGARRPIANVHPVSANPPASPQ